LGFLLWIAGGVSRGAGSAPGGEVIRSLSTVLISRSGDPWGNDESPAMH